MGKLCPHVEFHPGIVSLSLSPSTLLFFSPSFRSFFRLLFFSLSRSSFLKEAWNLSPDGGIRFERFRLLSRKCAKWKIHGGRRFIGAIDDCRPMRSLFSPWVKRNEKERKERWEPARNSFRCDCQWFVNEESKADKRSTGSRVAANRAGLPYPTTSIDFRFITYFFPIS